MDDIFLQYNAHTIKELSLTESEPGKDEDGMTEVRESVMLKVGNL
jgi:hypothetical protein